MRPSTIVSVIATACLSIAGSLVAAALFLQPAPSAESSASATTDVVVAFYEAANEAIANGNTQPLDAVLSPGFVDREPALGVTPDRDGLRDYLLALHTANAAWQLQADPILTANNRAMARVTVTDDSPTSPQGQAISGGGAPWAPVESFRVERGMITERWSSNLGLTLIRPLASGAVDVPAPFPRLVTLRRLALSPGGTFDHLTDGPTFLVLEQGTLQVTVASTDDSSATSPAATPLPLAHGQSFAVPSDSRFEMLNVGGGDALALLVRFDQPRLSSAAVVPEPPMSPVPNNTTSQSLAGGLAVELTEGSWRIAFDSVTLGSRAATTISSSTGPALVSATSGAFEISSWGQVWLRGQEHGMNVPIGNSSTGLTAGDGLTLQTGSQVTLTNTDSTPATAVVMTLTPA